MSDTFRFKQAKQCQCGAKLYGKEIRCPSCELMRGVIDCAVRAVMRPYR